MKLLKFEPDQRAPLNKGVLKLFDKVLGVLSPGQQQIFSAISLTFDTSRLSQSIKMAAKKAKQPEWLAKQELHYIEHVIRLFSHKVVEKEGIISREEMMNLFPLLAPVERLGLQKQFCDLFRHDLKRRLGKNVSIGYVREFFSLGVSEKNLLMEAGISKSLLREVSRNLKQMGLPSLEDSDERKMLSHYLTKSMQHYRNGLTVKQVLWLDTVRWGGFNISDIFSETQISSYRISEMKREAKRFLIDEPVFRRSPLLDVDYTGDLSDFERSC